MLKGPGTIITSEGQSWVCMYGNPAMASAGMGDLLAGMIAGFLAQGVENALAVKYATLLHSHAADLVKKYGQRGMLASDLIPDIVQLLNNN